VDEVSQEDLFDVIKVFQTTYATRSDLVPPDTDEANLIEITADHLNKSLQAILTAEWENDQNDPVALHVEVEVTRLIPNGLPEHSFPYRRTLRLSNGEVSTA
jgi:hypothetical protein